MGIGEFISSGKEKVSKSLGVAALSAQLLSTIEPATAALTNESFSAGAATNSLRLSELKALGVKEVSTTNANSFASLTNIMPGAVFLQRVSPQEAISKFTSNASVVFDSTHEYKTQYWMMIDELRQKGFQVVQNRGAFTDIPRSINIVYLSQSFCSVPYLPEEVAALEKFVSAGGTLVIVASKDSPAARQVAKSFGVEVVENAGLKSPLTFSSFLCKEGAKSPSISTSQNWCFVKPGAEAAMMDSAGKMVGVRCQYGTGEKKGTVLCLPDLGGDWQPTKDNLPGLMQCMLPSGVGLCTTKGAMATFFTDMSIEKDGCKFDWAVPLTPWVKAAVERFFEIRQSVKNERLLLNVPEKPVRATLVTSAGEGYAGGGLAVTLGVVGRPSDFNMVCAHELGHHYSTGLPLSFEEGYAYLCETRVSEVYDPLIAGKEARARWNEGMRQGKDSHSMDMSACGSVAGDTWYGRAMWMIEKWESAFGKEFMPKVVAANGALKKGKITLTLPEFTYVIKWVAEIVAGPNPKIDGKPLAQWLKDEGLQSPSKPIRSAEVFAKAEAAIKNTPARKTEGGIAWLGTNMPPVAAATNAIKATPLTR